MKKNAIAKKTANMPLVTVTPWAPEADTVTKIAHLDRIAKECGQFSIKAAIMCGWMLSVEKASRQGTFVGWMEANIPFTVKTAYNYMNLFEKCVANVTDHFQLDCDEKARQQMIEEYAANVESKTLTDLYVENGIVKPTKSNLGGKREGAGRKRKLTDEEALAAAADQIAHSAELSKTEVSGYISSLYEAGIARGGFGALESSDLQDVCTTLSDILKKAKEILQSRKAKGKGEGER